MITQFNPALTFDTLVVGASNRLAATAARTTAENPGSSYNPLFIYGQTGLGKTHLLMAIGQLVQSLAPDSKVEYWTLHEFVESFHQAVSTARIDDFHDSIREIDVVLLDDVQFLAHSKEIQSELLRIATELQEAGKQLVLASDRPAAEIADLDQRLLQQLGGGLVVDLDVPEFETRLAILQRRSEDKGSKFSTEVLTAVAEMDVQNVRALLGILNRLYAFQSVSEEDLTPEEALALVMGEAMPQSTQTASTPEEPAESGSTDEFGRFLSDLSVTVTEQVDSWTDRIRHAITEWSGRGYSTDILETLLDLDVPGATDAAVKAYEATVDRLRALEAEMASLDPNAARNPVFKSPDRLEEAEELVKRAQQEFVPAPGPSDAYSLEQFALGDSNRVAFGAARAVLEQPGARYNPLIIVGPPGLGKTHLLHAIGRALQDAQGLTVACLAAEAFVEELVDAIERDAVPPWRARFRNTSAFLLDDVHKIGSRQESQDELFRLFNLLADTGRQLIFTSDVPPGDIPGLDERLSSRMEAGLVAMIDPPDPALRRVILATQLQSRVGSTDPELIEYLAERATDSVQSLLNVLQRALNGAETLGTALSVDVAREVLEPTKKPEARTSAAIRTSGMIISPTKGIRSREKFVWEWPDPMGRIVDEVS